MTDTAFAAAAAAGLDVAALTPGGPIIGRAVLAIGLPAIAVAGAPLPVLVAAADVLPVADVTVSELPPVEPLRLTVEPCCPGCDAPLGADEGIACRRCWAAANGDDPDGPPPPLGAERGVAADSDHAVAAALLGGVLDRLWTAPEPLTAAWLDAAIATEASALDAPAGASSAARARLTADAAAGLGLPPDHGGVIARYLADPLTQTAGSSEVAGWLLSAMERLDPEALRRRLDAEVAPAVEDEDA